MKKYHQSPTLGVRSGKRRWTPYVEERNSHDPPIKIYEIYKNHAMLAKNMTEYVGKNREPDMDSSRTLT